MELLVFGSGTSRVRKMGITDILNEIDALPGEQRWKVLEHTRHLVDPDIPDSFKEAMAEIERGEVIDLDEALQALESHE